MRGRMWSRFTALGANTKGLLLTVQRGYDLQAQRPHHIVHSWR